MSDKKISQLTASTLPLAGTEVLPIVQSGETKKVATDDLTVKNLRSNATTGILQMAGVTTGQTRVATVPDANFTVARTDAAQTFTGLQQFSDLDIVQPIVGSSPRRIDVVNNSDATIAGINGFRFNFNDNRADILLIRGNTDRDGSGVGLYSSNAWFVDPTLALEVMRDQNVKVNVGNLVIGTAGKGIDFSADPAAAGMTSELLDDYEEGTWTPVYVAQTGTLGAITYENVQGQYVKIGRQVTVTGGFYCSAFAAGTGSGDLLVGGLPFTNSGVFSTAAIGDSRLFTLNNPTSGFVNVSATTVLLYYRATANGVTNPLQVSDAATGAGALNLIYFTATYQV